VSLPDRIDAAFARAAENGYDMAAIDDADLLACDLVDFDCDFAREDFGAVRAACENWLDRQLGRRP